MEGIDAFLMILVVLSRRGGWFVEGRVGGGQYDGGRWCLE